MNQKGGVSAEETGRDGSELWKSELFIVKTSLMAPNFLSWVEIVDLQLLGNF